MYDQKHHDGEDGNEVVESHLHPPAHCGLVGITLHPREQRGALFGGFLLVGLQPLARGLHLLLESLRSGGQPTQQRQSLFGGHSEIINQAVFSGGGRFGTDQQTRQILVGIPPLNGVGYVGRAHQRVPVNLIVTGTKITLQII